MNPLQALWHQIRTAFEEAGISDQSGEESPEDRAIGSYRLFSLIEQQLADLNPDEYPWVNDIYSRDGNEMFAIVSSGGRLLRYQIEVSDGETVTLSEPQQVTEAFPPVGRTIIARQADGRHRWFSTSCSAVLNRVGEIDSRELFDSFIRHAEEAGEYPYRTFFHRGRAFRTGQADYLARDGNIYLSSGLFDEDNELATAEIEARLKDPDYWGESIGYETQDEPEMVEMGDAVVPVYKNGIHREISTLPEDMAASWFTTSKVQEVTRMLNDTELEALVKLFGDDEGKAKAWLADNVDAANRAIEERGMITRADVDDTDQAADDVPTDADSEDETVTDAQGEPVEQDVEIDDETLGAIVRSVSESEPVRAIVEPVEKAIAELSEQVKRLKAALAKSNARIEELERDEGEKWDERLADMPQSRTLRVTHRPRQVRAVGKNGSDVESLAERAAATLENIKEY